MAWPERGSPRGDGAASWARRRPARRAQPGPPRRWRTSALSPPTRRREVDGLRALVVVGLVLFHSALVFDTRDDFYVKNDVTVELTGVGAGVVVVWAMPLLFAVAGLAAAHSLARRGPGGFARERLQRLGVPLVASTVLLSPVPQWLRARGAGHPDAASYADFWRRFFDVRIDLAEFPFVLQGEWFEVGHLWFVVLLLVGSFVVAALRSWRAAAGRLDAVPEWVAARRGAVLLPGLAIGAACIPGLEEGFAAGNRWAFVLTFLAGSVLLAVPAGRAAVRRERWWALGVGLGAFAVAGTAFLVLDDVLVAPTPVAAAGRAAFGAAGWCLVVAILGLLDRGEVRSGDAVPDRPRRSRVPGRVGELVLPFYVLHQPVVVVVAYVVVRTDLPAPVKFVAIVAASLVLTSALALGAQRATATRLLLGMRVGGRRSSSAARRRRERYNSRR